MPFIAFLGCDGSGKSAVISAISRQLTSNGETVRTGHWCPGTGRSGDDASQPHSRPPRGAVASAAKLVLLGVRWWRGWFSGLGKTAADGWVLFDRYHGDLLVDPKRYRYGGSLQAAKVVTRCLPRPDLVIFLDAPPETLWSRKQEIPPETLALSREAYLEFCRSEPLAMIIDASKPLPDVIAATIAACSEAAGNS